MKNRKILLLCLLLFYTLNIIASDVLTLDSALTLAAKNNSEIKKARYEISRAKAAKNEVRGNYFPQVEINGGGYHALNPILEYGINDIPNANVRDLLNTLYAEYGATAGLPNSIEVFQQTAVASAVAVQPIYMGGKITAGNKLANVGIKAAELQSDITQRDVLLSVEENYWLIVGLEEKRQTINSVQMLLDTLHFQVQRAITAGVAMSNDLLSVELRQNEIEEQRLKLDNGIALARLALSYSIGISVDSIKELECIASTDSVLPLINRSSTTHRPEHQLLKYKIQSEELQKRMTLANALPQIAIGATYSYLGFSSTKYKSDDNRLPTGNSWNSRDNGLLFVSVKIPLSSWGMTSYKLKQHEALITEAEIDQLDLTQKMTLQENQAYNAMEEAYSQITRQQNGVKSAKENLRLMRINYEAGLTSITELLQAQTLLLQAENNLSDAKISYRIHKRKYEALTK
ncbi:MAG: TolC family protein [Candidatus Aphodosoma sp.]